MLLSACRKFVRIRNQIQREIRHAERSYQTNAGMNPIPSFRVMFVDAPGARPLYERYVTGSEPLREFLADKLGEDEGAVRRVIAELETSRGGVRCVFHSEKAAVIRARRAGRKRGEQRTMARRVAPRLPDVSLASRESVLELLTVIATRLLNGELVPGVASVVISAASAALHCMEIVPEQPAQVIFTVHQPDGESAGRSERGGVPCRQQNRQLRAGGAASQLAGTALRRGEEASAKPVLLKNRDR